MPTTLHAVRVSGSDVVDRERDNSFAAGRVRAVAGAGDDFLALREVTHMLGCGHRPPR